MFYDKFMENLWMRIVRFDSVNQLFRAGSSVLTPTRSVADLAALQAIPKVASNDNLVVYVKNQPKHKSLFVYTHSTANWRMLGGRIGAAADSIMWMGDTYFQGGLDGPLPLMTPGKPYYVNIPTFTNLGAFVRNLRGAPGNGSSTGVLSYNRTTKMMTWQASGDSVGPAVNVTTGGWYRLESATAGKEVCVAIMKTSEPGSSGSDNVTFNTIPAMVSYSVSPAMLFNQKYSRPFGDREVFYCMNGLGTFQALASAAQWENIDTDITVLDLCTSSQGSSIAQADITIGELSTIVSKRQAVGSRVIVCNTVLCNVLSDARVQFLPYFTRKLKALAESMGFEIVDVNRYYADPAGTVSNPARTKVMDASLQYHSAVGANIREKYGLTPVLSKYLPAKTYPEWELIPYSITEPFGNLLTNGRLTGTAGTKSDGSSGRITGDIPTSYTATLTTTGGHTMTAVCVAPDSASPVYKGEGLPDKLFRVTLANVAVDDEQFSFNQSAAISASNYVAGDKITMSGELKISATNGGIRHIYFYLNATNARAYVLNNNVSSQGFSDLDGESMLFKFQTEPFILQASPGPLNFVFQVRMAAGGTAVIEFSPNLCIRKII